MRDNINAVLAYNEQKLASTGVVIIIVIVLGVNLPLDALLLCLLVPLNCLVQNKSIFL